jgi:hypothetical protein
MSVNLETINLGNLANDGTGDDLREAFRKTRDNFIQIESLLDNAIFGSDLEAGDHISLVLVGDKIQVSVNFQGNVDFNDQNIVNVGDLQVGGVIELVGSGSRLFGNVTGTLSGNVAGGTIYAGSNPVVAQGDVVGRNGLITNPSDPNYAPALVDGISIQDLNRSATTFDFGPIIFNATNAFVNPLSYVLSQVGYDGGSFSVDPAVQYIDAGEFI